VPKLFKDTAGLEWSLCINVETIKRVRTMLNIDLIDAIEGKLISQLASDPILLCDVVYALVKVEADARGVSSDQFGARMGGDAIEFATTALLEELVNFFPLRRRQTLTKALQKFREVESKGAALIDKKLEAINVDSVLENAGFTSTNQPDK